MLSLTATNIVRSVTRRQRPWRLRRRDTPAPMLGMTLPDLTALYADLDTAGPAPAAPAAAKLPAPRRTRAAKTHPAAAATIAGTGTLLKVEQLRAELGISASTWEKWRLTGKTPRLLRLPNGSLRCYQPWLDAWLMSFLEPDAAPEA